MTFSVELCDKHQASKHSKKFPTSHGDAMMSHLHESIDLKKAKNEGPSSERSVRNNGSGEEFSSVLALQMEVDRKRPESLLATPPLFPAGKQNLPYNHR